MPRSVRRRPRPARTQRESARKENGSKNRDKARVKVARVHARIADRRRDHPHKLTTRLVRENTVPVNRVVVVDRFYPSSKICSVCGHQVSALPPGVREWTCTACGAVHDRDVNAARNLEAAGLAVMACGAGIRPQRKTPGGRLAAKQETQPVTVGILSP